MADDVYTRYVALGGTPIWRSVAGAPSMVQPDTWSNDRVHGSTKGHILFAAAAAEALDLPGSKHDWARTTRVRRHRHFVRARPRNCCGRRTCSARGCGTTPAGYPVAMAAGRNARGWTAWSVRSREV